MMNTTQRTFLRHKLNPRKYERLILYRVTEAMSRADAIRTAKKIRRVGKLIRIDDFQGEYAVWVTLKKIRVPVPKGRLGLDDSATKYFNSLLPEYWYVVIGNKHTQYVEHGYFISIIIVTARGSSFHMDIYEHKKYLEMYSIKSEVTGSGDGSIVMKAIKKYVDAKRKGVVLRIVKNYRFIERFKYYKQFPREYGETEFPDYYYKVSPKMKLRHLWV